uniref:NADH-ubiquinone oxidoreductase chain 5 n=1 Tax=Amphiura sp. CZ-2022 TaxID=2993812 RepID=A0A9E8D0B7_9ECHI|nr:NADH dehydrogenase subunit 5 [Amphiura sp. CZ-2022]
MILTLSIFLSFSIFLVFSFFTNNNSKSSITNLILSVSSGIGIIGGSAWVTFGCPHFILSVSWLGTQLQEISAAFLIDTSFISFSSVALFVTWSIIEFSHHYMTNDPNKQNFFGTLILFLFFMLLLVSSNSLFLLFIGWEGVGILSFVLIGWWFTRNDANSAALQAIIYNRIGDTGMILFLLFSITQLNSWNLNEIIFFNINSPLSQWALLGIIIAAAGKSAQFTFHPWLPSAMEGPTPVSALLHSSTMVVAGVILLIRCHPLLSSSSWALNTISLLGALTALFAASVALLQFDIKKIVAYSTTSQLGLMVVAVGLNLPWLALFHICTHAFFKALLFLCSGNIIHSLNNEQDIRKMGNSSLGLPFTTSCFAIGSIALSGLPFLAGYYSKDLILEAGQNNLTNSISIILALIATLMTALYSARILAYLFLNNNTIHQSTPMNEDNLNLLSPLLRLLIGALIIGWAFSLSFFSHAPIIIPLFLKSLPLLLTALAIILIFWPASNPPSKIFLIHSSNFLLSNWFYVQLNHGNTLRIFIRGSITGVLQSLDQGWTSRFGPSGTTLLLLPLSNVLQKAHNAFLNHYLAYTFFH